MLQRNSFLNLCLKLFCQTDTATKLMVNMFLRLLSYKDLGNTANMNLMPTFAPVCVSKVQNKLAGHLFYAWAHHCFQSFYLPILSQNLLPRQVSWHTVRGRQQISCCIFIAFERAVKKVKLPDHLQGPPRRQNISLWSAPPPESCPNKEQLARSLLSCHCSRKLLECRVSL